VSDYRPFPTTVMGAMVIGSGGSGIGNLADTMRVVRFSLRPARPLVEGQQATSCAVGGIGIDIATIPFIVVGAFATCVSGRDPICGGGPAANAPQEIVTALIGICEIDTCTSTARFER
jgi:hypothetical protein